MCVILEHASLLISLTVGLTELPSNGTKLLEGLRPSDFEEQNSVEEALKLIWVLTIDPSKHFRTPDARLNLNCLTLLPALPLPCVHVPGVVRGDLPVEESAGKVILSAQLEESGEGCVLWRALGNLLGVLWPEVNPLAVLKVDSELLDGRVTLVDWKTKDPPDRFFVADVPAGVVHLDLIPLCLCDVEDCHIRALVDVLADILDALHRVRELDIDVGLESAGDEGLYGTIHLFSISIS